MSRVIAIDGPSASGKSTVARKVAGRLGWIYVDSGSLYRGITWLAIKSGTDTGKAGAVDKLVEGMEFSFSVGNGGVCFRINGKDPGEAIRSAEVNALVSVVAAVPSVRRKVVSSLKSLVRFGDLVMEGRDIGTAVFPGAAHKFYLDASIEERARRRNAEAGSGEGVEETGKQLACRDAIDSRRQMDPLRKAEGAVVIDSTGIDAEGVADLIVEHLGGNG